MKRGRVDADYVVDASDNGQLLVRQANQESEESLNGLCCCVTCACHGRVWRHLVINRYQRRTAARHNKLSGVLLGGATQADTGQHFYGSQIGQVTKCILRREWC